MKLLRYLPRFQAAYRELETLAAREVWLRGEIEAFQLQRLNQLWREARANTAYYHDLASEYRLPEQFVSLDEYRQRMPLLTKQTVRNDHDRLFSGTKSSGQWLRSSGSTGTPTSVYWSTAARCATLRAKYRFYTQWNVDIFDRTAFVWGHPPRGHEPALARGVRQLRQWASDRMRNRLRLWPDQLTPAVLQRHLRKLTAFNPAAIYTYPTIAWLLAKEAQTARFTCPALKLVNYTSEAATPRMVETIEAAFRVPAVAEYGSTECGFLAGEGPDRTLRVREDIALLETLPRDDGRHDIIVTPLVNPAFPLLRYAIGDVTDQPLQTASRGFATLVNVAGRANDLIVTATGSWLTAGALEQVFDQSPEVRRYRVEQRADGSCHVLVEIENASADVVARLRRDLLDLLEGYSVDMEALALLPECPGGKHRWITSALAAPATSVRASIDPVPLHS